MVTYVAGTPAYGSRGPEATRPRPLREASTSRPTSLPNRRESRADRLQVGDRGDDQVLGPGQGGGPVELAASVVFAIPAASSWRSGATNIKHSETLMRKAGGFADIMEQYVRKSLALMHNLNSHKKDYGT